jgi:hypothetical protein
MIKNHTVVTRCYGIGSYGTHTCHFIDLVLCNLFHLLSLSAGPPARPPPPRRPRPGGVCPRVGRPGAWLFSATPRDTEASTRTEGSNNHMTIFWLLSRRFYTQQFCLRPISDQGCSHFTHRVYTVPGSQAGGVSHPRALLLLHHGVQVDSWHLRSRQFSSRLIQRIRWE